MRMSWRRRHELGQMWYVHLYKAFFDSPPTRATGKRSVRIHLFYRNRRDYPNLWLAADKLILDNLVKLGWLVNDDAKHLDITLVGDTLRDVKPIVPKPMAQIEITGEGA